MRILGIDIDESSRAETLACLEAMLDEPHFHRIATVNPEFLVRAESDSTFRVNLLQAERRIADGFGITLVAFLRRARVPARFAGADLTEKILALAQDRGSAVYLAVRADGLSSFRETKAAILRRYPDLIVTGDVIRPPEAAQYRSSAARARIVLCNFGAPEQEYFVESLRTAPGDIRLALGVGGSFDYWTGKQTRAPRFMRTAGLEWLWRLISQPKRIGRIFQATVVFLFLCTIESHITKKDHREKAS